MAGRAVVDAFISALRDGVALDELAGTLAPDVDFVSAVTGPTTGIDAVVSQLRRFHEAGRFVKATSWSGSDNGGEVSVTAFFPIDSYYDRYVWKFDFDAEGKVARIAQTGVQQTQPLPESPVHIGEELATALRIAGETRNPLIVAYIDAAGRPSQAPRGTVQVFSDTQLALWVHNPAGGLAQGVRANPNLSIHYWGGIGTAFGGALQFQGVATIAKDESIRDAVYGNSPASEQRSDPNRLGICLIVDVVHISGFVAGTRYNMIER